MKSAIGILMVLMLILVSCRPAPAPPTLLPTVAPVESPLPPPTEALPPTEAPPTQPAASPQPLEPDTPEPETTAAILERLGGYACPDSEFTCIDVQVPLDHFNAQDSRMIKVVFGVLPASGERKGTFVIANGGPGVSGLLSADSYTPYYDPAILEQYDIVFFDQRGVNLSGGLQCIQAAASFYMYDWDASSPAGEELLLDAAETFAKDCVEEMGNPELLPFMDTLQAVEDLEIFLEQVGAREIILYGESYGSQFAQTFASAHPERLQGLLIDGTVDLTLTGHEFLTGQATGFNRVLLEMFDSCASDEACAEAFESDATAVYDRLAARLKQSPVEFEFPLATGEKAGREFAFSDLETAAAGYMYSETGRMIFLRALAAYARNEDLVSLARTLYDSLVVDPQTLEPILDPSYSDAVYYAVECRDYSYASGSVEESALAYLRAGDDLDTELPRFSSVFYGDLPCVFWPNAQQDPQRPPPLTDEPYPIFVLNAESDPVTPIENAQAIFDRLEDGYLITESGGPHIIYAWGLACVDDRVTAYLIDGELPEQRETSCEGTVVDAFVPLAALNSADYASPLEALSAVDLEIYYLPEYYYWDYETPTAIGCPFGGSLSFEPSDLGESFTLTGCAFSEGFVMTGAGTYNYDEELFTMDLTVSGLKDGTLTYTRDADWATSVVGEYGGEAVDISN